MEIINNKTFSSVWDAIADIPKQAVNLQALAEIGKLFKKNIFAPAKKRETQQYKAHKSQRAGDRP